MLTLLLSCTSTAEQVKLAWDENLEPDLAGYRIYYGVQPHDFANMVEVGLATDGVVEGLQPGTEYFFAVTAYNQAGLESEPSETVRFRAAQVFTLQTFTGLIGEGSGPQGSFAATVTAHGGVTGRVVFDGKVYRWRGVFDRNGELTVEILRKNAPVVSLNLLRSGGGGSIRGTAQIGGAPAELLAYPASHESFHQSAGRYTMTLAKEDSGLGGGYGFGTIQVSKRGLARFAGILPGGARFGLGVRLDSAITAPLYQFQPAKRRAISGRVHFRDLPQESDADGVLRLQIRGEDEEIVLQAARHSLDVRTERSAGTASTMELPDLTLHMRGRKENELISVALTGRNPLVGRAGSGELVTVRISSRTGLFSGICKPTVGAGFKFAGAIYQKNKLVGFGQVRAARGSIELHPLLQ